MLALSFWSRRPKVPSWALLAAPCWVGAASACDFVVEGAPPSPFVQYEVFAFDRAIAESELTVRNRGEAPCALVVSIETLAGAPPPFAITGADLFVDVLAPDLQEPQREEVVPGVFELPLGPGEQRTVRLDFIADQSAVVPAGTYEEQVELTVREQTDAVPPERFVLSIGVDAAPQAQVNLSGTDGTYGVATTDRIDFGEPEAGEERRLFVQVRANADTRVTMRSREGGRMAHASVPGAYVPYVVEVDGQAVDLSAPAVVGAYGPTAMEGLNRPMTVRLGETVNPYAGEYTDEIVVEIAAQ